MEQDGIEVAGGCHPLCIPPPLYINIVVYTFYMNLHFYSLGMIDDHLLSCQIGNLTNPRYRRSVLGPIPETA